MKRAAAGPTRNVPPSGEAGENLADPAAGGEGGDVAEVERGIEFGEVDQLHLLLRGEMTGGREEHVDRHAAGAGAGRAGTFRAVDHVDVEIDHDRRDMAEAGERVVDQAEDAEAAHIGDGGDADAGVDRGAVHGRRIGIGCKADLADVPSRQPVLQQASDRIAVHRPLVRVPEVEMRVEGDETHLSQRHAETMRRGVGDAVMAAEQKRQCVRGRCGRYRIAKRREPLLGSLRLEGDIALIADAKAKLVASLDIIGAEAAQRLADEIGREVIGGGRDRSLLHRCAEERDLGGTIADEEIGDAGPVRHGLAP